MVSRHFSAPVDYCISVCCGIAVLLLLAYFSVGGEYAALRREARHRLLDRAVAAPCSPSANNVGKLVFISCPVDASVLPYVGKGSVLPETLGASVNPFLALGVEWDTEIYQWVEHGTETFRYVKEWTSRPIDSANFSCSPKTEVTSSCPEGVASPKNHGALPTNIHPLRKRWLVSAGVVKIGTSAHGLHYGLDEALTEQLYSLGSPVQISWRMPHPPQLNLPSGSVSTHIVQQPKGKVDFIQSFPKGASPEIGDIRIKISAVSTPSWVSLVGKQANVTRNGSFNFESYSAQEDSFGVAGLMSWLGATPLSLLEKGDKKLQQLAGPSDRSIRLLFDVLTHVATHCLLVILLVFGAGGAAFVSCKLFATRRVHEVYLPPAPAPQILEDEDDHLKYAKEHLLHAASGLSRHAGQKFVEWF